MPHSSSLSSSLFRSPLSLTVLLMVFIFACSITLVSASTYTTKIASGNEECFVERIKRGTQIGFSFISTTGGEENEIDSVVLSTRYLDSKGSGSLSSDFFIVNDELNRWTKVSHGAHRHNVYQNAKGIDHQLVACISNKGSIWKDKMVSFSFISMAIEDDDKIIPEMVSDQEKRINSVNQILFEMMQEMVRIKNSEAVHRSMIESTNSWIAYGSILSCIVLLSMTIFQYWYLKSFINKRATSM